ncbi:efflux RND transporter periplasmic adaptor subunit [Mucilaginibacter sp. UYCu711]|uniref:efflux RND transporter periplasmic adaptor subunit n=1 Tax=Mucilaginibacter sp. UYCu711 TaxID=3156339 RepID=UPI003D2165AE
MIKFNNHTTAFKMVSLFCLAFLFLISLNSCHHKAAQQAVVKAQSRAYYTCSMHPQVHEDHDGNCPICSMKLIKVEMTGTMNNMAGDKIILTATQIQLAAIQTDTVKEQNTGNEKTLTGTVTTDETGAQELSARLAGRIQRLFLRAVGEKINIGQPIYSIYSEDLQEAEKEYLLAKQQQKLLHNPDVDYQQLIVAAESKLQLWGLSLSQINSLAASGKVSASMVVLSKINGTVSDIAVHEGDYVTEGMTILKAQSLNRLWVEAQLYANEAGIYKVNDPVNVSLPDLGGQLISGKVEFINPELSETSKVDLIRISIPNPQGLIRPGMLAYLSIGSATNKALAVPASAILTDSNRSKVWVKNTDGSFSPKTIKVGLGNQNYVSIISGLSPGSIVVTHGAYLLNSEAIFKNGGDQMAGMKM